MSSRIALVSGLVLSLLFGIGFSAMSMMKGKGMMNMSMVRHHYVMKNGIGSEYSSKENSLVANKDNFHTGKMLYEKNCLSCHGSSGYGDGPAGKT